MSDKYVLFLSSKYLPRDNDFYLKFLKGRTIIAVDGGIRFFLKNKIVPDILIGDFDSSPKISKKYLSPIEVITHPSKKNKTDSHLAIELALNRGAKDIMICGAISENEIDHTLSNIFLLHLINDYGKKHQQKIKSKIISLSSQIFLLDNSAVKIEGKKGDIVSILPLSDCKLLEYSNLGYLSPQDSVQFGNSLTLRNRMTFNHCLVSVQGQAIVVHLFNSSKL